MARVVFQYQWINYFQIKVLMVNLLKIFKVCRSRFCY